MLPLTNAGQRRNCGPTQTLPKQPPVPQTGITELLRDSVWANVKAMGSGVQDVGFNRISVAYHVNQAKPPRL